MRRPCRKSIALTACAVLSLFVHSARAADSPGLEPGDRVRVNYPSGPTASSKKHNITAPLVTTITGYLASITDSTLTVKIAPSQPATVVPRSDQLVVERCTRLSGRGKGAIAGAILGSMTGAVVGGIGAGGDGSYSSGGAAAVALACAAAVGLVGAGVGALVSPGEKWEPVAPMPPARMGIVAPREQALRVPVVTLRF